ncbi:concanavalin A-like lectin/glucanases superfamily protein [Collimonas fungivorans]|uniref:Concanavalin A-like lectin/glucanases superfamily protein n=1 Tax=Collimonas fungivorans TaxID=158899 RepID=A0A127P6X7_9BURK|nr:LamG-like jellyroll fold domain-containing protein [Collimonas fungivorans]AMO93201.1 concanavalin A-like lectin/glucanases superfamily protein [Collimonas fungivorans]
MSRRNFMSSIGILLLAGCGGGGDMSTATSVGDTGATPATPVPAAAPVVPASPGAAPVTTITSVTTTTPETTPETPTTPASTAFVHPGLLHTQADFDRMSQKVKAKASPWIDGWNVLIANGHGSLDYKPNPQAIVYRGNDGVHGQNFGVLYNDVAAAYACALRWKISGDELYAKKAVQIMNAWSSTLTEIGGTIDGFLALGIQGYQFANAGEIMRNYSGWAAADFARFQNMMRNVFYTLNDHGLNVSLAPITVYSSWQLCCMASILAIGVLCDDKAIFNEAIDYFKNGVGNGAVAQTIYYIHPGYLGQTQESGRDQGHNTLSISLLTTICEMAWNQGVDLYGYDNNRVLAGAEYVAKGNLIQFGTTYYTVPFATYQNSNVTDTAFSTDAQGNQRPEWALIYNHYVNRKGLAAPYSQKFAALVQPEGGGGNYGPNSGGYDQLGYGTLTCTRDPIASGAAPSGLTAIASASAAQVILSWWGSAYATSYNVMRSTNAGGPYTTIATGITDLLTYTDTGLAPGAYYYVVAAVTPSGVTAGSNEAKAITAVQLQTYLAFDDDSGTIAADSSGNGNNGTLINGVTWASGKKGSAVSLNGNNGYVSLPANIMADVSDVTITAWVYWNTSSTWARVFDFGAGSSHYMMLTGRSGTGVARFEMTVNGGTGLHGINSTAALPTGQWVHVAVTLSGNIGTLYVNGSSVGTNTAMLLAPFRLGSTNQNWIGRSQFANDPYFNGLVDQFRIYRGALSAAQIATLM